MKGVTFSKPWFVMGDAWCEKTTRHAPRTTHHEPRSAMRHFLDIPDLTADELSHLLTEAARLKASRNPAEMPLRGRVVALVFEKPSLRTRVSFESAVAQLGVTSLFLPGNEVGLGWRESIEDFARTIGQYVDALVLRVFKHETVSRLAALSGCPVVNGLSDVAHPCQALADLLTI